MSEVELVWIRDCEICGTEHRKLADLCVESMEDAVAKTGAFCTKCERWYEAHVAALQTSRLSTDIRPQALVEAS